jgi:hypothetical protein
MKAMIQSKKHALMIRLDSVSTAILKQNQYQKYTIKTETLEVGTPTMSFNFPS